MWALILCFSFSSRAQDKRLEVPFKINESPPLVIPVGAAGVFIANFSENRKKRGKKLFTLGHYDSLLNKSWEKEVAYPKNLKLSGYEGFDDKLYMVFHAVNARGFYVIRADPHSGTVNTIPIRYLDKFVFHDFVVYQDKIFITGQMRNIATGVMADLLTGTTKPIPTAFRGKNIEARHINANDGRVFISFTLEDRNNREVIIREIDPQTGKILRDLVVRPEGQYDLISGQVTKLNERESIVIGTYAYKNKESTQGFYFAGFVDEELVFTKYHSFTDLDNFFGFLSEERAEKIMEKVSRKKERGKDLKLKYEFLVHDLIRKGDEYIMLGEAYYPVYRTERVYRYYAGARYYDYVQVFDGYQYTHATVAGFNTNGNILWDQSFPIEETRLFRLKELVSAWSEGDNTLLVYNHEGKINQMAIENDRLVFSGSTRLVDTGFSGDNVRNASLGDSEHWYSKNFLFWGYQKIKNSNQNTKRRNIFYVNKVMF